ncbi:hypothetical protein [Ferruginibacter sp. HRS2-29]|uniref:hypothetical protein n=1 Tax=Ferruginibacter sp. HRS2-29 TaxID=2487334 RepID=UPI0020CE53CD|nr:hypothetical protein [Ferruginibacter sp. HRS2-29]MCP9753125.1 hypothetical protein [Ferruginibacter sp. HRS2-29]
MKTFQNIVTKGLSGRILQLVFKQWAGMTYVASAPSRSAVPATEEQKQTRLNFKEAVRYAKRKMDDPAMKSLYQQSLKPRQTAFNRAIKDFMTVPVIGFIHAGNYNNKPFSHIIVRATDDFRVMNVKVKIENSAGQWIEEGEASPAGNGLDWKYLVTESDQVAADNVITVTVSDMAGNEVSKQA